MLGTPGAVGALPQGCQTYLCSSPQKCICVLRETTAGLEFSLIAGGAPDLTGQMVSGNCQTWRIPTFGIEEWRRLVICSNHPILPHRFGLDFSCMPQKARKSPLGLFWTPSNCTGKSAPTLPRAVLLRHCWAPLAALKAPPQTKIRGLRFWQAKSGMSHNSDTLFRSCHSDFSKIDEPRDF